jgi:hypothetical protein
MATPAKPPATPKLAVRKAGAWAEFMANVRELIAVNAECGGDLSKLQLDALTARDLLALHEAEAVLEKLKREMEKELKARADKP